MGKNIVICIDGTGNEFGVNNSNVVRLYSVLSNDEQNQIAYYHPGLGTMGSPNAISRVGKLWTKLCGQAFGYGLGGALEDSYRYLMENYSDRDRIFLFGFSRGAYCVRALAAMIHMYGLLQKGNEPLIRYVLKMFKHKNRSEEYFQLGGEFKATFSRPCKIYFVGLWDTVSSVGWMYDPVTLPFTAMNPSVAIGRHAVSIDEKRAAFRQNLWRGERAPGQDIEQVWFAGVHSDIGGGYPEAESGLAKIPLQWMIENAQENGLIIDSGRMKDILGITNAKMAKPDCLARLHRSLCRFWWVLELFPRRHLDTRIAPPAWRWKIPFSSPRHIPPGSTIHASVLERIARDPDYQPKNLPEIKNIAQQRVGV
jgi:uncharacterized protein (DUF2235 family)